MAEIGLSKRLLEAKVCGLDTMLFIYFFEDSPLFQDEVGEIFQLLRKGRIEVVTSVVTLLEILSLPELEKRRIMRARYVEFFRQSPSLTLYPVDPIIAEIAASLRRKYRLRAPDAIQVATAIYVKAGIFITNDAYLRKIEEIQVHVLSQG